MSSWARMKQHPVARLRPLACALPHRKPTSLGPPSSQAWHCDDGLVGGISRLPGPSVSRTCVLTKLDDRRAQGSGKTATRSVRTTAPAPLVRVAVEREGAGEKQSTRVERESVELWRCPRP